MKLGSACLVIAVAAWLGTDRSWAELPEAVEEMKQRMAQQAEDPVAAVKLWFEALFVYMEDSKTGSDMISLVMYEPAWDAPANQIFVDRLNERPWIFRSYAQGTRPQDGYRMDPDDFELVVTEVRGEPEDGTVRIFLRSSGADNPRPIVMRKGDDGLFRAYLYSPIYVGVRPPPFDGAQDGLRPHVGDPEPAEGPPQS